MPLTVSSRVLSAKSGLPLRQVQTLTEAGVLKPDEGSEAPGRGGSRQYGMAELELAQLLGAIAFKGMSSGEAAELAAVLRPIVQAPQIFGFQNLEQARQLRRYVAALETVKDKNKALRERAAATIKEFKPIWGKAPIDDKTSSIIEAWVCLQLAKSRAAESILFLGRDKTGEYGFTLLRFGNLPPEEGDWQYYIETLEFGEAKGGASPSPRSGYAIVLSQVFHRDA